MAEGRMAEVVSERHRLGQILVESERPARAARDLRHFEAVCEAGAVVVALVIDEYLRLVFEPPERRRMDDPFAVALEHRAARALGLPVQPSTAALRCHGIGGERGGSPHGAGSYSRPPALATPPTGLTIGRQDLH